MIQLTFQPAFDSFHTIFRLLRLRLVLQKLALPIDHVRILDFFLLFPFRVSVIRLTPQHRRFARIEKSYADHKPYGEQPSDREVFLRMSAIHAVAFQSIASQGLIDGERLAGTRTVFWTAVPTPQDMAVRIDELNAAQSDLMEFLGVLASDYPLSGPNGLKGRTGLMDHRYDAV